MVNNKFRFVIFFTAEDGEALYSQQKQDQELTVAQIMDTSPPEPHVVIFAHVVSLYYIQLSSRETLALLIYSSRNNLRLFKMSSCLVNVTSSSFVFIASLCL